MKESPNENVEDCSFENQGSLSCEESLSIYAWSYAKSLSDIEPFSYISENLTNHFDAGTDDL